MTEEDGRRHKKKEGVFTHEYRQSLSLREWKHRDIYWFDKDSMKAWYRTYMPRDEDENQNVCLLAILESRHIFPGPL